MTDKWGDILARYGVVRGAAALLLATIIFFGLQIAFPEVMAAVARWPWAQVFSFAIAFAFCLAGGVLLVEIGLALIRAPKRFQQMRARRSAINAANVAKSELEARQAEVRRDYLARLAEAEVELLSLFCADSALLDYITTQRKPLKLSHMHGIQQLTQHNVLTVSYARDAGRPYRTLQIVDGVVPLIEARLGKKTIRNVFIIAPSQVPATA